MDPWSAENKQFNSIKRIEFHPDGWTDFVIISFDDTDTQPSSSSVKVGAYINSTGHLKIQASTKFEFTTNYGGKISRFTITGGNPNYGTIKSHLQRINFDKDNSKYVHDDFTSAEWSYYVNSNADNQNSYRFWTSGDLFGQKLIYTYTQWSSEASYGYTADIAQIDMTWDQGDLPAPSAPKLSCASTNTGTGTNGEIIFNNSVRINVAPGNENESVDFYYVIAENPVDDIDINEANTFKVSNGTLTLDKSGYLSVVSANTSGGKKGAISQLHVSKLDNVVFDNLADAQVEANNNKLVTFSCPLLIEGIQNTQNNAKFMYVRDPQGNAIKFVNNSADIFFNESKHYKVGQEIPAYGITGVYRHTEGWPQIEVYVGAGSDYRRYSADATYVMTDFDDYDPKRTTFGADDFNRHVVVSNLT